MTARASRRALPFGLALAGALLNPPPVLRAQDVLSLHGTFAWDSTPGDDVAETIQATIADLDLPHARFARDHIHGATAPYRAVAIEQDEETISIATDGGEPIRAPASGEWVEWAGSDGTRTRVSLARQDGAIRQTLVSEGLERENLFQPTRDGRGMTMTVTLRMGALPEPIRYTLVYRREAPNSRMRRYLWDVAGPLPVVLTFLGTGVDQLRDVPEEWDPDSGVQVWHGVDPGFGASESDAGVPRWKDTDPGAPHQHPRAHAEGPLMGRASSRDNAERPSSGRID